MATNEKAEKPKVPAHQLAADEVYEKIRECNMALERAARAGVIVEVRVRTGEAPDLRAMAPRTTLDARAYQPQYISDSYTRDDFDDDDDK